MGADATCADVMEKLNEAKHNTVATIRVANSIDLSGKHKSVCQEFSRVLLALSRKLNAQVLTSLSHVDMLIAACQKQSDTAEGLGLTDEFLIDPEVERHLEIQRQLMRSFKASYFALLASKEEHDAAASIQHAFRSKKLKNGFPHLVEIVVARLRQNKRVEKLNQAKRRQRAAIIIQSAYRSKVFRQKFIFMVRSTFKQATSKELRKKVEVKSLTFDTPDKLLENIVYEEVGVSGHVQATQTAGGTPTSSGGLQRNGGEGTVAFTYSSPMGGLLTSAGSSKSKKAGLKTSGKSSPPGVFSSSSGGEALVSKSKKDGLKGSGKSIRLPGTRLRSGGRRSATRPIGGPEPRAPTRRRGSIGCPDLRAPTRRRGSSVVLVHSRAKTRSGGAMSLNAGPTEVISAATFEKLIEKMTNPHYTEPEFAEKMVETFQMFKISHLQFLDALIMRYKTAPTSDPDKVFLVRLAALSVLKYWVKTFVSDLSCRSEVMIPLQKFIDGILKTINDSAAPKSDSWASDPQADVFKRVRKIRVIFTAEEKFRKLGGSSVRTSVMSDLTISDFPEAHVPAPPAGETMCILDVRPVELARQLTLIQHSQVRQIRLPELLNVRWMGDNADLLAPHVISSLGSEDRLTKWAEYQIVTPDPVRVKKGDEQAVAYRAKVIEHLIEMGMHCAKLQNLLGTKAIATALQATPIERLTTVWKKGQFKKLKAYSDLEGNMVKARGLNDMAAQALPAVPMLWITLKDLFFTHEGNPTFKGENKELLNVSKARMTADLIHELQKFQTSGYCLQPLDSVQDLLLQDLPEDIDDQLYKNSYKIVPRGS